MDTTTFSADTGTPGLRERNELVAKLQGAAIFRDYQRAFHAITGLPLVVRAAGALPSGLGGARGTSAFCALLETKSTTCGACLQLQERLEQGAVDHANTRECFGGLIESAIPVRVGDRIVAYLQTGQIHFHAPTAARFRRHAREILAQDPAADLRALEAAFLAARVVGKAQYEAIIRLLEIFARQLSGLTNQLMVKETLAEAPAVARARAYIASHLADDLSLSQVASATGMSSFYFCKSFKKGTGLTFTAYLSRVRVEAVKQLFLNPHKRISEAAYEAGFQSLSQFNRMFHRIAGESPSQYRNRLHPESPRPGAHVARLAAA